MPFGLSKSSRYCRVRQIYSGFLRGYGHRQDCHAHISYRPRTKEALRIAADQQHRSITNMVEVLIWGYCERHGIAIPHSEETKNNNGARS